MAKASKTLAIVVLADVPNEATLLLEAQGHCLYTLQQAVQAGVTRIDAVVGGSAWRIPAAWWMKDGTLSPHAKVMLKAVTAQAYPDKPKAKKRG